MCVALAPLAHIKLIRMSDNSRQLVAEARIHEAQPNAPGYAEYKFELPDGSASEWRRWKECVPFSIELMQSHGVPPLDLSARRLMAQLSGKSLSVEHVRTGQEKRGQFTHVASH